MRIRIAVVAAVAASAVVAVTSTIANAEPVPAGVTVDIRVELDLPNNSSAGPKVFEVLGVTPGPGPELTGADEVDNPSEWCSALAVDIDPDTSEVTVTTDEPCDLETASLTLTWSQAPAGVAMVSDDLFITNFPGGQPPAEPASHDRYTLALAGSTITRTWAWDVHPVAGPYRWPSEAGSAVIAIDWTQPDPTEPTTTTTVATEPTVVTPTSTPPPSEPTPTPVVPIRARATYTG